MGGPPMDPSGGSQQNPINVKKIKSISVWDALEKIIKNKGEQKDQK
jgi:hypothetical protein